jgi:hypothetical protein
MEIVSILRALGRHRLLVAAGVFGAVFIGLVLAYQVSLFPPKLVSRQHPAGVATARVLLAARTESTFDLESKVTETLGARAFVLADLLATDVSRAQIARTAGLEPGQVAVMGPSMGPPKLEIPLAVDAAEAAATGSEPYMLNVTATGNDPIVSIRATGPNAAAAARVADAASSGLDELIASKSVGTPDFVVERLGPAVGKTVIVGPQHAVAVMVVLVLLSLWCAAIVVVAGLARRSRGRKERIFARVGFNG